jgi:excisionase family DNA binding protein
MRRFPLTIKELAVRTGFMERTLRLWCEKGYLAHTRTGRNYELRASAVEQARRIARRNQRRSKAWLAYQKVI